MSQCGEVGIGDHVSKLRIRVIRVVEVSPTAENTVRQDLLIFGQY